MLTTIPVLCGSGREARMIKRIVAVGVCIFILMVVIKDGRVLRSTGLTGSCSVTQTFTDSSELAACRAGKLKAEPAVLVANRPDLKDLARKHKLPFVVVPWQDRATAEEVAREVLEENQVDFVVLARFMKILSPAFVWRYKNKLINIHPSLLPSFPGSQAYRQAYERGVKVMGVTAHFVTMNLDEGPIIAQASFPVRPGMALTDIVAAGQKLETEVMVKAVRLYLKKRLDVHWGIVREV